MAGTTTGWDIATAVGTCVAAGTVFVAVIALFAQRRSDRENSRAQTQQLEAQTQQLDQARRASQAQVYQSLLDKAERVGLTQALETVRSLYYDNYEDFRAHTSDTEKENVIIAASFFNDVQRLLDAEMLDYNLVTGLWTLSILSCADHLWVWGSWSNEPQPWWLNGFRDERSGAFEADEMSRWFYLGFQRICTQVKRQFDPGHVGPGNLIPVDTTTTTTGTPPATSPPA
jgi:uncharacterized membrane protein